MKTKPSTNSLAILSLLAGVVYLMILIPEIISGWEGGVEGAKSGFTESRRWDENPDNNVERETFYVRLKRKDKNDYFPDDVLNSRTQEYIPVRYDEMRLHYQFRDSRSLGMILFKTLLMFGALPVLFLLILIPVQFYKLIFSLYRNNVFNQLNVKRIEKIGIYYIIVYGYQLLFELYEYQAAKSVIDLEKYQIAHPEYINSLLLIGLVALIIATVMKRALSIKEEQELTI
jgi:hypothetical protein